MPSGSTSTPTLLTKHGETPGKVYDLTSDVTVIGRDLTCDIVLNRKFVSRRHARIVFTRDGYDMEDLSSNCGTLMDGKRISGPERLKDGSHIKIGNYLFIFNHPALLVTDKEEDSSTILGVLDLTRALDSYGSTVRPEEKLRHVLEITRKLAESLRIDDVLEKTLEGLFKIFPQADRGFVLLKEGDIVDPTPRAIKFRSGQAGSVTISRTILNHVLHEGKAILSTDAATDRRFDPSLSIVGEIRMMMCVPLLDPQRETRGILQLDTCDDRGKFDQEDLDLLVAVASQVSVAVENARLLAALIERTLIEQESQDAQEVQQTLLPERRPELAGYSFWDFYEPARYVGGDYFDYLPLPGADAHDESSPRRWLLAVADVAGKGMPAALLMARLSAEVRLFALTTSDPARIVERLNQDLCRRAVGERFITFLIVLADAETHRLTVVSAGHSGPIIRRADGRLEIVGEGQAGPPLGVTEGAVYTSSVADVRPGDLVLLYTDGLIEAMDASGRCFGIDRLRQVALGGQRGAEAVGTSIIRAVQRHSSGCPQSDDITLLCFERLATPIPTPLNPPS